MTHIVILSGGLDSTVALATAHASTPGNVVGVSFDYGQRHARELAAAAAVTAHYRIRHQVLDLSGLMRGSALLGEAPVPEGHYAAETMSATVVNGRNLLFAAAAIASTSHPGDTVWTGVHAGDHPVYADCRPEFWAALATAAEAYEIDIRAPFLTIPKSEIVYIGDSLDAPLELTWSCYQGGDQHCGRCGTCVERAEAFDAAGVPDPTTYADPDFWRTVSLANPV